MIASRYRLSLVTSAPGSLGGGTADAGWKEKYEMLKDSYGKLKVNSARFVSVHVSHLVSLPPLLALGGEGSPGPEALLAGPCFRPMYIPLSAPSSQLRVAC
jgi:hypothetical protein